MQLLEELKRRNVLRVGGLYLVGAWLLTQVATTVLPLFDTPGWVLRALVVVLVVAFVPTLVFSWVFELTPEGLKRDADVDRSASIAPATGKRIDRLMLVVLSLALGYFAFDKFVLAPRREAALQQQKDEEVAAARKQGSVEALVQSYGDRSIAVLPFANLSGDKEQEYFSDGISEELLNQLARIHELRVIARTSSFAFKGKDVGVAEIARQLNVAHILEGSIRKAGNKVRVNAELIRSADSSHLWSETYDREMADIFAVQDEISAAVVAQLKITLLGAAPKVHAVDPKAYALYLQAGQFFRLRTSEALAQGVELLKQALAIAPEYAEAWSRLGGFYVAQADLSMRPVAEGYQLAREAVDKALALDPNLGMAQAALGWIAMNHDLDQTAAAEHFTRALMLAPDDIEVLRNAGTVALNLGRIDSAIAISEAVSARDPLSVSGHVTLCIDYLYAGRMDDVIASARTALGLNPKFFIAHYMAGVALMAKGQPKEALAEMQQEPEGPWHSIGLPLAWHALGNKAESDAALADLIRKFENDSAYNIAYVYAYRGETDRAFEWLDKAVANKDAGLSEIGVQPLFANIRRDPRWLPLLRKLGRAPEQLAAIPFEVKLPGGSAIGAKKPGAP